MDSGNGGGSDAFTRVLIAITVLFSLTTAGTMVKQRAAPEPEPAATHDRVPPAAPTPAAASEPARTEPPKAKYTPRTQPLKLVHRFLGVYYREEPAPSSDQAAIRDVVAKLNEQGVRSQVLIATLPDWVDSSLQWTFDSMLDAIQMSAAQMQYVLTGYDLPNSKIQWTPGSLLFRRVKPGGESGGANVDLLLVLLAAETTTNGVHPRALANALDFALWWNADALRPAPSQPNLQPGGVAILGPVYSGSALSVQRALKDAAARRGLSESSQNVWFEVVTPSASNSKNPSYLDITGLSSFGAVARSDDEVLSALAEFLGGIKKEWRCGDGVALLVESNTTWGLGIAQGEGGPEKGNTKNKCEICRTNNSTNKIVNELACATYVPFPLHISRLRGEAQREVLTSEAALPNDSVTHVDLDETSSAADRIAPVTPGLTAAMVELMVAGMFRSIDDRTITAIGVLATDKRDHVFLAQEIARRRPNILPFTIESSLLYLHPDVRSYLRGTVIASTYSLNTRTQAMTNPARSLLFTQQFASSASHGVYNALALLLGEPAHLLDYDMPAGPGDTVPKDPGKDPGTTPCRNPDQPCSPPVWISVVAKDGLLPLRAIKGECRPMFSSASSAYTTCGPASSEGRDTKLAGNFLDSRNLIVHLGVFLVVALVWHQLWLRHGYRLAPQSERESRAKKVPALRRVGSWAKGLWLWPGNASRTEIERAASFVALRAATVAIALCVLKLIAVLLADSRQESPEIWSHAYAVVAAVAILFVTVDLILRFWHMRADVARWRVDLARTIAFLLGVAMFVWATDGARFRTLLVPVLLGFLIAGASICTDFSRTPWKRLAERVDHWRRIPVLFGLAALICLGVYLTRDNWGSVDAILYFDRSASVGNLASPVAFILLTAGALYWWGAWNRRRVDLLRLPETEIGIGTFLQSRAQRGGVDAERLRQPTLGMGLSIVLPVAAVIAAAYGYQYGSSIEGHRFDGFLFLASACILAIMGHTLAHSVTLGTSVIRLLRSVAHHPAAEVIKTVAKEPFPWHITTRDPLRSDFEPLARRVERLLKSRSDEPDLLTPLEKDMSAVVEGLCRANVTPEEDRMTASDWRSLDTLVGKFCTILDRTRWSPGYVASAGSDALREALDQMEVVVVFHGAIVLRDLLTRLVSGFATVVGGFILLLAAHLLYTFQGRLYWLSLDAVAIALTATFAIRQLIVLERNAVLSDLWGTQPGKVSFFGKLTWRMVGYTVIAVLTLLAVFFPEIGGRLAQWIEPARKLVLL